MTGKSSNDKCHFGLNGSPRQTLLIAAIVAALSLMALNVHAAGTAAGSIISNFATIEYLMNGTSTTQNSNVNTLVVDDKLSFTLTAADVANVTITPGGRASMTYLLTNTGNAPHDFTLNAGAVGAPAFNPSAGPVFYSDAAGTTPLPSDPRAGNLPYLGNLAPDATATVYMFITAPAQLTDGESISHLVTAESYQPATLGKVTPPVKSSTQAAADATANKNTNPMVRYVILADGHGNGGDADRDGVYGVIARDGNGNTIGFKAQSATVTIAKTATITDRTGGNQPVSGAIIHYSLAVSTAGAGKAVGVVIADPIPVNTTYLAGTLKLNGTLLSDAADSDAGDVTGTAAGVVTVKLGDMTSVTPEQVITFDVKID